MAELQINGNNSCNINSNEEEKTDYLEKGIEMQQTFYEDLGDRDWNELLNGEYEYLKLNIAFCFYNYSFVEQSTEQSIVKYSEISSEKSKKLSEEETKENLKHVDFIYNVVMENNSCKDKLLYNIIYIYLYNEGEKYANAYPVIVINGKCNPIFVDHTGRVYSSWSHFIKTNEYPECTMICPQNGKYTGEIVGWNELRVQIEIIISPAKKTSSKILNLVDQGSSVLSLATLPVFVGGIFSASLVAPLILPAVVTSAAVGAYSTVRSGVKIADRHKHKQNIGLGDASARGHWLGALTGALSIAAPLSNNILARCVQSGRNINKVAKVAVDGVNILNLVGAGTNLAFQGYHTYKKYRDDEEWSYSEIAQFTASILLLTNSVYTFQSAQALIQETQNNVLDSYKNTLRSKRHKKLFDKAIKESKRINGNEQGNKEIISGIKKIDNPDNFFAGLAKINKQLNKEGARYTINKEGEITINNDLNVKPETFYEVGPSQRAEILRNLPKPDLKVNLATPGTSNGSKSCIYFNSETIAFCKELNFIVSQFDFEYIKEMFKESVDIAMDLIQELILSVKKNLKELKEKIRKTGFSIIKFTADFILLYMEENKDILAGDINNIFRRETLADILLKFCIYVCRHIVTSTIS